MGDFARFVPLGAHCLPWIRPVTKVYAFLDAGQVWQPASPCLDAELCLIQQPGSYNVMVSGYYVRCSSGPSTARRTTRLCADISGEHSETWVRNRLGTTIMLPRLVGHDWPLANQVGKRPGNCQQDHREIEPHRRQMAKCSSRRVGPRRSDSFQVRHLILTHLRPFPSSLQFRRSHWLAATNSIVFVILLHAQHLFADLCRQPCSVLGHECHLPVDFVRPPTVAPIIYAYGAHYDSEFMICDHVHRKRQQC